MKHLAIMLLMFILPGCITVESMDDDYSDADVLTGWFVAGTHTEEPPQDDAVLISPYVLDHRGIPGVFVIGWELSALSDTLAVALSPDQTLSEDDVVFLENCTDTACLRTGFTYCQYTTANQLLCNGRAVDISTMLAQYGIPMTGYFVFAACDAYQCESQAAKVRLE